MGSASFTILPIEIRLEIYSYLLHLPPISREEDYCYRNQTTLPSPPSSYSSSSLASPAAIAAISSKGPSRVHAAILAASRQIHGETMPILYSENTFIAHPSMLTSFPRLRTWYPPVRESTVLPLIRRFHLQLRLDCDLPFSLDRMVSSFSGVEELNIDVVQSVFLGVGYSNLQAFEALRGIKSVTIRGSTTGFNSYIAWLEEIMTMTAGEDIGEFKPSEDDFSLRLSIAP